jgi:diamine N-acetyltransferase
MTVTLQPITQDNWTECVQLNVTEDQQQRHFVASNAISLAQACWEPWWVPLGIYDSNTMVGFVMYGRRPGTNINYILRMMVDARYQGRGYGKAGLLAVIERIRREDSGEI